MLRVDHLNTKETVYDQAPDNGPKTWYRGTEPIDRVWVLYNIVIMSAAYLQFDEELGDHIPVVVDIVMMLVLGSNRRRVLPKLARQINTKVGRVYKVYMWRSWRHASGSIMY
jgi:hypothetical protein